ncbi:MAG: hypothetical protein IPK17_05165 [Chloroflexi bacterium]|uniref:hypothetical protein n=1 Tax=Candidatus Flexifilum breve TaxID=3140694 RepID=UPI003134E20F|nr:hypothetical protein [Chloroflexota bacterium]
MTFISGGRRAPKPSALKTAFGIELITIRVTQTGVGDDTRPPLTVPYRGGDLPPDALWTLPEQSPPAAHAALDWLATEHPHRVPWYPSSSRPCVIVSARRTFT